MTSNFSAVSEETILDWVGPRNFQLGHSYFESRAIVDPRRQGKALKAWCQGSMPQPYRLQASFEHRGVVEADCSCPVGGGGRCKHVGALLLAWLHQPDAFRVVAELDSDLEQRSKPELIALIKQMLRPATRFGDSAGGNFAWRRPKGSSCESGQLPSPGIGRIPACRR